MFACVSNPLQSRARETEIKSKRERQRQREGGEERRSERETNYGTARRICDPGEQVRCFGPFDSDKAASPEFFLALGCRRRMRERESFHVVSPFVYHQAFVFCIHSNRCANRKILGLQQRNSCFCNCLSFHLHQDFLSFTTYHLLAKTRSILFHLHQDISLSFSTIVVKIRSIISLQLHQDIFSHSGQLCKDKDL